MLNAAETAMDVFSSFAFQTPNTAIYVQAEFGTKVK